jgi:hypothetical protein
MPLEASENWRLSAPVTVYRRFADAEGAAESRAQA